MVCCNRLPFLKLEFQRGTRGQSLKAGKPALSCLPLGYLPGQNSALAEATVGALLGSFQVMTIIKAQPAPGELGLTASLGAQDKRTRVSSMNCLGGGALNPISARTIRESFSLYTDLHPLACFLQMTHTLGCRLGNCTHAATATVVLPSTGRAVFILAQIGYSFFGEANVLRCHF